MIHNTYFYVTITFCYIRFSPQEVFVDRKRLLSAAKYVINSLLLI